MGALSAKEAMVEKLWKLATDNGWDLDTDAVSDALSPFDDDDDWPDEDDDDED